MCLAIPGKIIEVNEDKQHAVVEYGEGTRRKANISLVKVQVGDYVIVHAGFAIEKMKEKEARKTLDIFNEMIDKEEK